MNNIVFNKDCMIGMAEYPDKFFDVAIVDPPYGIGEDGRKTKSRDYLRFDPRNGRKINSPAKDYGNNGWDAKQPDQSYFDELFRVSKKVFIWGENYIKFQQKQSSTGRIIWNKFTGDNDFSDCEICWTNAFPSVRKFDFMWAGFRQGKSLKDGHINQGNKAMCEKRIHPTQKPVALYDWIILNYCKDCRTMLDTHIGSGSIRISCDKAGIDLIGFENNGKHFADQEKRFAEYKMQARLFTPTLPTS